jgi:hypothetical protein
VRSARSHTPGEHLASNIGNALMIAPGYVCKALYRLHPQLRLGWYGDDRGEEFGSFAIIQLYHISDAGTENDPKTLFQRWNPTGQHMGPIFNKNGGTSLDYDPLFRVPIVKAKLSDYGINTANVLNGRFLDLVKSWLIPLGRRMREDALERASTFKSNKESMVNEMSKDLWSEAQKPDAITNNIAYKHCKDDIVAFEKRAESNASGVDSYFKRTGM